MHVELVHMSLVINPDIWTVSVHLIHLTISGGYQKIKILSLHKVPPLLGTVLELAALAVVRGIAQKNTAFPISRPGWRQVCAQKVLS